MAVIDWNFSYCHYWNSLSF